MDKQQQKKACKIATGNLDISMKNELIKRMEQDIMLKIKERVEILAAKILSEEFKNFERDEMVVTDNAPDYDVYYNAEIVAKVRVHGEDVGDKFKYIMVYHRVRLVKGLTKAITDNITRADKDGNNL